MTPITSIHTPFPEKFGIPRQSLLVNEAKGLLKFPKNDFYHEAFRGIEESSHLWLIFDFHLIKEDNFNGLVRPPRFEGKKKMGVYATRSPHRPNKLGLSVVKFESIIYLQNEIVLQVSGVDLADGTPIYDIKPYVPYTDRIDAVSPFQKQESFSVNWSCEKVPGAELIEKIIALDPRPQHDKDSQEEYGVSIAGYNVRFKFLVTHFEIISAVSIK
jgi:tRNA-Thr(GGU) m(6)t(6)A37 methyltransferase TsaA